MKKSIFKFILIVAVIAYIGKISINTINGREKTTLVKYGNIVQCINADGYIIRNEMIIASPFTGKVKKLVSSGVRVPKGTEIVEVYSSTFDESKLNQLDEINKEIKLQSVNNPFYSDIKKLDDMINQKEINYQEAVKNNSSNADKIKKDIDDLKKKREQIISKGPASLQKFEDLNSEKMILEQYINSNMSIVNSPQAGVISFYYDGYGDILNVRNMYNLNSKIFSSVNAQPKEIDTNVLQDGFLVNVIDNLNWYLAVPLSENEYKLIKEGSSVKILIDGYNNELRGKVIKLYKGDDKIYVGIIDMIDIYKDFYKNRKLNIKIIINDYSGMEVPVSSIVNRNGETGVFVIKNGKYPVFKVVTIKAKDDKNAIVESSDKISGLRLYDEIAINGKDYLNR